MKTKLVIISIIFAISSTFLLAQKNSDTLTTRPQNSFALNMFGDASITSVGYERLFANKPGFFLTGKIGIGLNQEFKICVWGPCDPPEMFLTIPHHITANFGKGRHFLEIGLGGSIIAGNTRQHYFIYPILGYRFQPIKSKKLNFRIYGSIPFTGMNTDDIMFIPVGLSLGWCF